ncbi:ATP-dependent RNA helicase SrmB [Methylorubrum extorquens]
MIPPLLALEVSRSASDQIKAALASTDLLFDRVVDRFVARERAFLQGPWLSIDMPFMGGGVGSDFFPDIPMAFPPHAHQVKAFRRLASPTPRSTLVATGTGSGKTESFLLPILDHCLKAKARSEPGIKAILVYPMNALAIDQARRIARVVADNANLAGRIRAGIYADREPDNASDAMTDREIITSRHAMRTDPPDILLTNYKMLDYLLVRPEDAALWEKNDASTLRYIVVDELHTFDGAQGTDLALLLRRLKSHLGVGRGHVASVGTSATLGSEGAEQLALYASRIFGEEFDVSSVVTESRKSAADYLFEFDPSINVVPDEERLAVLLRGAAARSSLDVLQDLEEMYFGLRSSSLEVEEARIALGERINLHVLFHGLLKALDKASRSYEEIFAKLRLNPYLRERSDDGLRDIVDGLVALISHARSRAANGRLSPFLAVRMQSWMREATRMVASVSRAPELHHARDLEPEILRRTLPLASCRHCGTTGWATLAPNRGEQWWADPQVVSRAFVVGGEQRLRILFPKPLARRRKGLSHGGVVPGIMCSECLAFNARDEGGKDCPSCRKEGVAFHVTMYDPVTTSLTVDRTCPSCGGKHGLAIFGARAATLATGAVATMFGSQHNDDPKLLLFHDSIQDAAHRAAVIERRTTSTFLRTRLAAHLSSAAELSLSSVASGFPASERARLGEDAYVGSFLPSDLAWRRDYVALQERDALPPGSRLPDGLDYRIAFEIYAESTFRSRMGNSLERAETAILHVDDSDILRIASEVQRGWKDVVGDLAPPPRIDQLEGFVAVVLDHMRATGAVLVDEIRLYAWQNGARNPYFAVLSILQNQGKPAWALPRYGRNVAFPSLPATGRSEAWDEIGKVDGRGWYRSALEKIVDVGFTIVEVRAALKSIYSLVFDAASRAGVVEKVVRSQEEGTYVWGLRPEKLRFHTTTSSVRCVSCGNRHLVPSASVDTWTKASCTQIGCDGTFEEAPDASASYLDNLFDRAGMKRVVAREHTSLLERDDRVRLEEAFIAGDHVWNPNLLSATPTLEMGIDIGDLSTTILGSIPPEQANYLQRIGRTGRRDGNSFNLAIATSRESDLWYWAQPEEMIRGSVRAPGVHLGAFAILRRQFAAFTLDRWIASTKPKGDVYGDLRTVLRVLGSDQRTGFPKNWFKFIYESATRLVEDFLALLPIEIARSPEISSRMDGYARGGDREEGSLTFQVAFEVSQARQEREAYVRRLKEVEKGVAELRKADQAIPEVRTELEKLKVDRAALGKLIRRIDDTRMLQFLTDRGILPNYAFPEEGVTLKSTIWWPSKDAEGDVGVELFEFPRPAGSALADLAPGATFYAAGRQVVIDQVDLSVSDPQTWRICDACTHMVLDATVPAGQTHCPSCSSDQWGDLAGRRHSMVLLKQVLARTEAKDAPISDDDARRSVRFDRDVIPSPDPSMISKSFGLRGGTVPFGFEFVRHCSFRDVNFGRFSEGTDKLQFAGVKRAGAGFAVCTDCGRLQTGENIPGEKGQHTVRCGKRDELDPVKYRRSVFLYREFTSEAVKVHLPVVANATDDDIKSFVSAVEFGIRQHFGGRVDHLRALVAEENRGPLTLRHLYLYDTVPGGTGYLRQIGGEPEIMHAILAAAVEGMRGCSCNTDPLKNGCHRCIRSHRSWYGKGEALRDRAVVMLGDVLKDWDGLVPLKTLSEIAEETPVESTLEAMFLEAVATKARDGGVFRKRATASGLPGYVVRIKDGELLWELETQVWIGERFGIDVYTRADFVFVPVGPAADKARPIAIYTDGWTFHADKVASDLTKREAIRASGTVDVLSITWADLTETGIGLGHCANPFASGGDGASDAQDRQIVNNLAGEQVLSAALAATRRSSMGLLFELLWGGRETPIREASAAGVLALAKGMGSAERSGGISGEDLCRRRYPAGFDAWVGGFHDPVFAFVSVEGVTLGAGVEASRLESERIDPRDLRMIVAFDAMEFADAKRSWNGALRLANVLGFAGGFTIGCPNSPPPSSPRTEAVFSTVSDAEWNEVYGLLRYSENQEVLTTLLDVFRGAGAPIPAVGADLVVGDVVVGEAELLWSDRKLAVVAITQAVAGWTVLDVHAAAGDPQHLLTILKGEQS